MILGNKTMRLTYSNADTIQDIPGNPGMDAFRLLRASAKANGIQDMSLCFLPPQKENMSA